MVFDVKSFETGPIQPSHGSPSFIHLLSHPSRVIGPKHRMPFFKKQSKFSSPRTISSGLGFILIISASKFSSIFSLRGQLAHKTFSDRLVSLFSINLIKIFPNNLEGGGHPGIIPSISI
ncbi:hypothetical protein ES703_57755 [subsurface metagenome]